MTGKSIITSIDILRHGECEGGHIFRGKTDVHLSDVGMAQMRRACERLDQNWSIVVSSPLKRCLAFSKALTDEKMLPLDVCNKLREMSFGDWDGCEVAHIWDTQRELMSAWRNDPEKVTPPNAEPITQVASRVESALRYIVKLYAGRKVLVVTHGGVFRLVLAHILSTPLSKVNHVDVPYACLSRIEYYSSGEDDFFKLVAHNIAV